MENTASPMARRNTVLACAYIGSPGVAGGAGGSGMAIVKVNGLVVKAT